MGKMHENSLITIILWKPSYKDTVPNPLLFLLINMHSFPFPNLFAKVPSVGVGMAQWVRTFSGWKRKTGMLQFFKNCCEEHSYYHKGFRFAHTYSVKLSFCTGIFYYFFTFWMLLIFISCSNNVLLVVVSCFHTEAENLLNLKYNVGPILGECLILITWTKILNTRFWSIAGSFSAEIRSVSTRWSFVCVPAETPGTYVHLILRTTKILVFIWW